MNIGILILAAALGSAALLAVVIYIDSTANPFTRRTRKDIAQVSDQELLLTLDNLTIKTHSLDLAQLEAALAKRGDSFRVLYWCDLVRLYAFSCEGEVFQSFANSLTKEYWSAVYRSFIFFGFEPVASIALELSTQPSVSLEQAEHFRYSVRSQNEEMQEHICSFIRVNIDSFS